MPTQLTRKKYIQYCELFELNYHSPITAHLIHKPYVKLTLKYHPDKNRGDKKAEELFKFISVAKAELTDHILFYGNTLTSAIYDNPSDQKPNQNEKLLTGHILISASISVPDALEKIINVAPYLSHIQKNLLEAIVKVINEFNISNFKHWIERINDCRSFIKNAIDGNDEITTSLLYYYDRIVKYFNELKLILDEYDQIEESEKKYITSYKFNDGLDYIKNKLNITKQIIIENQETALLTDKSRLPLVRLGNHEKSYNKRNEDDDDNLAYKTNEQNSSNVTPPKNIPNIEISLQQFANIKGKLQNALRRNPIILSNNEPGLYFGLLRDLFNLSSDTISCSSDTLDIFIADTEKAYQDLTQPNCDHKENLKNALIPILNFLFKAFPTEFKNRKLALKFEKLLPPNGQLKTEASLAISLEPIFRRATPPLESSSTQSESRFWSNFADAFCGLFSCSSQRKNNQASDQQINSHDEENEPLISRIGNRKY